MKVRRRATRPEERASDPNPSEGAGEASDAIERILGGVVPHMGSRRQRELPPPLRLGEGVDEALAELASRPLANVHPLARFLFDRNVSLTEAARIFGMSRWTLADWIAGRSRPTWWRAAQIARALGVDVDALFPR